MDVKDIKIYLSDTMNILPSNIIQTMLTLLPMRDAFRTSILSQNWRHHCANIPKLHFDDEMFEGSASNKLSVQCKLTHVIYPILLLHRGPILDFSLCISELSSCYQIDQIIIYLSKNSTVKKFTLFIGIGDEKHLMGCWNSGFVELLECLPLIEYLHMSSYPIQCFATGDMPQKLPTLLDRLTVLNLSGLSFAREVEIRSALLLVTSSPNIQKIIMKMYYNPNEAVSQTAMNLFDLQDYSNVNLDHLRELEITNTSNMKPELDFVKLILAKSPMLKKAGIVIDNRVSVSNEVTMLRDLVQYRRASTKVEIVCTRP